MGGELLRSPEHFSDVIRQASATMRPEVNFRDTVVSNAAASLLYKIVFLLHSDLNFSL
jgi:hypothetical protein